MATEAYREANQWQYNTSALMVCYTAREQPPIPMSMMRNVTLAALVAISVTSTASAAVFYKKYQAASVNPQAVAQAEINDMLAKIGALIVLPTDEKPTIATVSDPEKLASQAFFKDAKQGDKVLIYTTAKKAILYDPTANKIIDVAPVSIGNNPTAAAEDGSDPQVLGAQDDAAKKRITE
jgi:hypothetical protein